MSDRIGFPGWVLLLLCMILLLGSAVYLTMLVSLGSFAFGNPDQNAWYGVINGKQYLFATQVDAITLSATDMSDVHGPFIRWFLWGFIQTLLLGVTLFVCCFGNNTVVKCIGVIGNVGGILAWWIYGLIWRFSTEGKYASGDVVPDGIEKA